MSGVVYFSDEVRTALGAEKAGRATQQTRFRCVQCNGRGDVQSGDDASVILMKFLGGNNIITLAHTYCLPSQVVATGQPPPVPVEHLKQTSSRWQSSRHHPKALVRSF